MRTTRLRGARTHNLRGIDLDIEPGTYLAIVGRSGAGKSSLAFGTLHAEGQRRYVESFSAYARQFLERLARPPVDALEPVPVGIAVDRRAPVRTSRSTVGTMTEVADYMKSLWAHAAEPCCPGCDQIVQRDSPASAAAQLLREAAEQKLVVTYPRLVPDAERFLGVREELLSEGYRRVLLGGEARELDSLPPSQALEGGGRLDVIADRTIARPRSRGRIVEALEAAMRHGGGRADVWTAAGESFAFSRELACASCGHEIPAPSPGLFSFNSPLGACERCRGFGRTIEVDFDRVIPDPSLPLGRGAIRAWKGKKATWERRQLRRHAARVGVPLDVPVGTLDEAQRRWLIEGEGKGWKNAWFGLRKWFEWMESRAYKMHVRVFLSRYRKYESCVECGGKRLRAEARLFRLGGLDLPGFYALPVSEAHDFLEAQVERFIDDPAIALLLRECLGRLEALREVGLGYLSLDRQSRTLSGGEAQRVALTAALGASLSGAMFVLDEPTVGLHPRDVERLLEVVQALTRDENIAVVVEHSASMIAGADRVLELGPGAGSAGGEIVFDGTPAALRRAGTATGKTLRRNKPVRRERREASGWIRLRGARGHNLQGVDLELPLGVLTCVTGVSGSGKSSLVIETLLPALARARGEKGDEAPLAHDSLEGAEAPSALVAVDQSPLGRTSRGNAATYLDAWTQIRKLFVSQPLSKERGYKPGAFSFNVSGGRCEACKGEGAETVEMQFLADVSFTCPECGGRRFVGPILDVRWGGLTVADLLEKTGDEAMTIFAALPAVLERLRPMVQVGLGYLRLGQPLNTLSGGEAQRLKLAKALAEAPPGALLLLDEPTAGLHRDDVRPLLAVLDAMVERGDTVVVVEHDMQVAASADHVIDLGPGPGKEGGRLVAAGTPEEVARAEGSETSAYLAEALGLPGASAGSEARAKARSARRSRRKKAAREAVMAIQGAREHNLQSLDVSIPRERLVVVTGPSGSGKSTLAFDILHAEAQRRYLETLSPYARQYMPQLPRPDVDGVTGVPPSVSLEQRTTRGGLTSTVATVTEVAHYLRLAWARAGTLHCPEHGRPIEPRSASALARDMEIRFGDSPLAILAPVVRAKKGNHRELLEKARRGGIEEARIDGEWIALTPKLSLSRYHEHDVQLVIARREASSPALVEDLREAFRRADGAAW
ncbi:MAG: excinuclease ABC subunit UvrA, partial [Myxococcales bacterium]|nr:excinuclease ABC subunit UvrA [Myxococcales bacterium]